MTRRCCGASTQCTTSISISTRPPACGFIAVSWRWRRRSAPRKCCCSASIAVVFHHSNLELPIDVEERLNAVLVTPRMHGIHHSTRPGETDSNYSSLLSCWDRLHRSLRLNVPQETITIGVAGYSTPEDVTLERSLTLPFRADPRRRPPAAAALRHTSA